MSSLGLKGLRNPKKTVYILWPLMHECPEVDSFPCSRLVQLLVLSFQAA